MFLKKYREIKEDYLKRSPRGKWLFVRSIGILFLKIGGVDILNPNFKVWWYSFVPAFIFIDLFASFAYTLWFYKDDPIRGVLSVPIFGVIIPVTI